MASTGDKFIYFLVGGFVGASIALLLAPKTGEETREFLENRYREGADRLSGKVQEGKERVAEKSLSMAGQVTDRIDQGKDIIQRQKEQASAAIAAGKEAYERERSKLAGVNSGKRAKRNQLPSELIPGYRVERSAS